MVSWPDPDLFRGGYTLPGTGDTEWEAAGEGGALSSDSESDESGEEEGSSEENERSGGGESFC